MQSQTIRPPSVVVRRGRGRVASLLLACLLSTAVVLFGPLQPASASLTIPPLVVAGAEAAAPEAEVLAAATPIGLVVNTVAVGVALYMSRDSWLPVVRGVLGKSGTSSIPQQGSSGACSAALAWTTPPQPGVNDQGPWSFSVSTASCYFSGVYQTDIVCANSAGSASAAISGNLAPFTISSSNYPTQYYNSFSISGCAAGLHPVEVRVRDGHGPNNCCGYYTDANGYMPIPGLNWSSGYSDSDTQYSTTVTCQRSDSTTFTLSRSGDTAPPVPSCVNADPGSHGVSLVVRAGPPGLPASSAPVVYTATVPSTSGTYPDCIGAGKACKLDLWLNGQPCQVGAVNCVDWSRHLSASYLTYTCHWGSYVVRLSDCYVLERAYESADGTQIRSAADTDGDPSTSSATSTGTGSTASPQPTAPQSLPTSGANPSAPATSPDATTSSDSQSCYGAAWGWNPVDWVYVPAKCALSWAFVPRHAPDYVAQVQGAWAGTAPVTYAAAFGTAMGSLSSLGDHVGGCTGPTLSIPFPERQPLQLRPLDACGPPMSTLAAIVNFILTVTAYGAAAVVIVRVFGASIGLTLPSFRGSRDES